MDAERGRRHTASGCCTDEPFQQAAADTGAPPLGHYVHGDECRDGGLQLPDGQTGDRAILVRDRAAGRQAIDPQFEIPVQSVRPSGNAVRLNLLHVRPFQTEQQREILRTDCAVAHGPIMPFGE